jgi:WD40 repeat protein
LAYYKISQEKTTFKESPVAMAKMLLLNLLLLVFSVPLYSQTAKLMLPIGHTQEVIDAVFSKDGKRVLTVSQDKTVKIWDGETGLLLASLKGHEGMIAMGVFSPDGKTILTVSEDRTARIWNSYNGNLIATMSYESEEIYDAGFSEDGKYIYAPFSDSALRFFDANNGKLLQTIKNPNAEFGWIAQHPDGNLIIATDETQKFGIWDKSSSKKIATLSGHKAKVEYVEYNKVNNKILSTAEDGIAIVWNLKGQKLFQITTNGNIREARFSPDGKYLFTYSDKFELSLWSADDGHKIIQFAAVSDELATVEFSIDSKRLVTTHLQSAYIWDIPSGKLFRKIDLL